MHYSLIFVGFLIFSATPALCDNSQSTSDLQTNESAPAPALRLLKIGTSVRHFDYLEGDGADDSERGTMPGLTLGYEHHPTDQNLFWGFNLDVISSHTQYNGSNMDKTIPVTSRTPTQLIELEWDLGFKVGQLTEQTPLNAYAGLGYHYWRRGDAGSTNGVKSYRENYTWAFLPVGMRVDFALGERLSVGMDASARMMFLGKLKAYNSDIDSRLADTNYDLGSKIGFKLQAPVVLKLTRSWSVALTPWAEYSAIGASNPKPLTTTDGATVVDDNGNPYLFLEPSSRTYQYGSNLGVQIAI